MKKKLAVLAFTLVALTACGSEDGGTFNPGNAPDISATEASEAPAEEPQAPKELNPCALFSKADVEKLTRAKSQDPVEVNGLCQYTSDPSGETAQVEIYVGNDSVTTFYETEKRLEHPFEDLDLGDEAHLGQDTIFLKKDGNWVGLRLVKLNDPAENKEFLKAAAETLASNM